MPKNHNKIDLTGVIFGRWTVIDESSFRGVDECVRWNCICECGKVGVIRGTELRKGLSTSCGCRKAEVARNQTKHGASRVGNRTSEYNTWLSMKSRCYDINHESYQDYGGRGVIVCEQWKDSFEVFLADMGLKPSSRHSIDRINVNGNYDPSNCRWATKKQQADNTRRNRWFEYNGEKMIMQDWADRFGVHYSNIHIMIKRGKTFEQVVGYYQNKKTAA